MTREGIEALVARWVPRLRLSHWELRVNWSRAAEEGTSATMRPSTSYDDAEVNFAPDFVKWSEDYAEQVVVHELLHLVTRDLEQVADACLEGLPSAAQRLASSAFQHEIEGVIDRLANALVGVAAR